MRFSAGPSEGPVCTFRSEDPFPEIGQNVFAAALSRIGHQRFFAEQSQGMRLRLEAFRTDHN